MSKFMNLTILVLIIVAAYIFFNQENSSKTINHNLLDYDKSLTIEEDRDKNIEIVKNGVLNYDKSLTVGEAFDNWKACHDNTSWTSFETDNKRKIVQFTCDTYIDHLDKHIIFQFTINKDTTFTLSYIGEEFVDTDGILSKASASKPFDVILEDIYENKTRFELN